MLEQRMYLRTHQHKVSKFSVVHYNLERDFEGNILVLKNKETWPVYWESNPNSSLISQCASKLKKEKKGCLGIRITAVEKWPNIQETGNQIKKHETW